VKYNLFVMQLVWSERFMHAVNERQGQRPLQNKEHSFTVCVCRYFDAVSLHLPGLTLQV